MLRSSYDCNGGWPAESGGRASRDSSTHAGSLEPARLYAPASVQCVSSYGSEFCIAIVCNMLSVATAQLAGFSHLGAAGARTAAAANPR